MVRGTMSVCARVRIGARGVRCRIGDRARASVPGLELEARPGLGTRLRHTVSIVPFAC